MTGTIPSPSHRKAKEDVFQVDDCSKKRSRGLSLFEEAFQMGL